MTTADLNALGRDTWRLYIDLDRQHRGSAAYDHGLGGVREPGYLASVLDAHAWIAEGAGGPVTLDDYLELHARVTAHDPPETTWRPGACWVHVPRVVLEPGLDALWGSLSVRLDEAAPARVGYVRVVMDLATGDTDAVRAHTRRLLAEGQARIAEAGDPVAAVAALHQQLELLHPTPDANTRRHLVLLQRLLANAGLPPCLLTEPNHVYARTPASWARCVEDGIARGRAVRHAQQRGLDVPRMLTEFDIRRRPRGVSLGRWHRPEARRTAWVDTSARPTT